MRCHIKKLRSDPGLFNNHVLCDATSKKLRSDPGLFNKHGQRDATATDLEATPVSSIVCLVVRDSRMWCPHGIGRDSWVWGEQKTLCSMNSPHEVGEEARHRMDLVVGRKRGVPGVRWLLLLLNLIISLRIIIVEPRPGVFAWDLCTFQQL